MFKRIKEFLNPPPKYSCTPKERYYSERGISEPVIGILRSMDERSKDWEIRSRDLSSYAFTWFDVKDKKIGLNFSIAYSKDIVSFSSEDDFIRIVNNQAISWVTPDEEVVLIKKLKVLYLKRLKRLENIKAISENKNKQKLRNEWKEKYQ